MTAPCTHQWHRVFYCGQYANVCKLCGTEQNSVFADIVRQKRALKLLALVEQNAALPTESFGRRMICRNLLTAIDKEDS